MEQNVQMLRGKMEFQYFTDLLDENKLNLKDARGTRRNLEAKNKPTFEIEDKINELQEQRIELKQDRTKFKSTMEDALNKLTKNHCATKCGAWFECCAAYRE